jgi:hypothetical protein
VIISAPFLRLDSQKLSKTTDKEIASAEMVLISAFLSTLLA